MKYCITYYVVLLQYSQSGLLVLLLRLAQGTHLDSSDEVFAILDLLSRMVSFNVVIEFNSSVLLA